MKKLFMVLLGSFVICNFCQRDFLVLKRHQWRCKSKTSMTEHNQTNNDSPNALFNNAAINLNNTSGRSNISSNMKCACGKNCKGLKGLKSHQRTCKTIKSISDKNYSNCDDEIQHNESEDISMDDVNEAPNFRQGINLPKTHED